MMTYKELLELYKKGELPEKEAEEIKKDIEKQEAIGDYLFDEDMPELDELASDSEAANQEDDKFLLLIRKSIRRAFIKTGVISGFVVLLLVLGVIFVLPGVVDNFYYNPNEIVGRDKESEFLTTNRMSLDMSVFSELFLPQSFRNEVNAESEGYGEYFVSIPQVVYSPNGNLKTVNGKLERNKLHFYDTDTFSEPAGNAFLAPDGIISNHHFIDVDGAPVGPQGRREEAIKYLEENEDRYYGAFISLKEVTPYEEAIKWLEEKIPQGGKIWCAAALVDEYDHLMESNIGFNARSAGLCINWDREAYPRLSLLDSEDDYFDSCREEEKMKEHFISLLKYQRDNFEFLEMTGHSTYGRGFFDDCIKIVEEKGLKVYGFYIEETKEDLLKLWEDEKVAYIYTTNIK